MLRALSTRRSRWGYEKLDNDDASSEALVPKLSRAKSLPAKILSCSRKFTDTTIIPAAAKTPFDQVKNASKIHPFFSLFDMTQKRPKKATAKPEVSRYLEYMREAGGMWDIRGDIAVVLYK